MEARSGDSTIRESPTSCLVMSTNGSIPELYSELGRSVESADEPGDGEGRHADGVLQEVVGRISWVAKKDSMS
jgi:hypothetical protein